jgi:hypothetical protein
MSNNPTITQLETDEEKFLKSLGRTPADEQARKITAMQILESWMNEEVTPEQNEINREFFADFREIIDRERKPGCKLFSEE